MRTRFCSPASPLPRPCLSLLSTALPVTPDRLFKHSSYLLFGFAQLSATPSSTSTSNSSSQNLKLADLPKEDLERGLSPRDSPKEARAFLRGLARSLGLKEGDYRAWYNVSSVDIINFGGKPFLDLKGGNVLELLRFAFPEHLWKQSFSATPISNRKHSLLSLKQTRDFLKDLGHKLGVDPLNYPIWYNVPYRTIEAEPRGQRHLIKFGHSRFELFSAVFPEHEWHPWLFKSLHSIRNRSGPNELKGFVEYLEKLLGVTRAEDWYGITRYDFEKIGLERKFRKQSDLLDLLRASYPTIKWDVGKMAWTTLGLSHLHATLEELFPGIVEYSKEFLSNLGRAPIPNLRDRVLVVPRFNLIFEYQGPISFAKQIMEAHENLVRTDSQDLISLSSELSLTLVSVPFWWDRDRASLLAEIYLKRKELFEGPGQLATFAALVRSSDPIPSFVPLRDLNVNSHYSRHWAQDPRFEHISTTLASHAPNGRK